MSIKDLLDSWKSVLSFAVAIIVAMWAILAWADDEKVLAEAKQQLIHNEMYQESRIDRKRDQIKEDKRELDNVIETVGTEAPTPRQTREIEKLDDNIAELEQDIEDIEENLRTDNE